MKQILVSAAAALAFGAAAPAFASAELAESKMCMQCHAIKEDGAGPSFQKIAAKWRKEPHPVRAIVAITRQGSGDEKPLHWGKARMPDDSERPQLSEREARAIARWILKQ